jgi:peptidoglycan hydrolase-like protein with peptidoglycan-binding domain
LFILNRRTVVTTVATTSAELVTGTVSTTTISTSISASISEPTSLPTLPQISQTPKYIFNKNLKQGSTGEDVRQLQIFLNKKGFTVSSSGAGSLGNETSYFGAKTFQAVKKYQEAYKAEILTPLGLRSGTGFFYVSTRAHVNKNNF